MKEKGEVGQLEKISNGGEKKETPKEHLHYTQKNILSFSTDGKGGGGKKYRWWGGDSKGETEKGILGKERHCAGGFLRRTNPQES